MKFNALFLVIPLLSFSQNSFGQSDIPSNANMAKIATFDILGIRIGTSEQQARALLATYRPNVKPNQLDFANKPIRLETSDIILKNPVDGKKVRAGFQIGYKGVGIDSAYDFVKVYIYQGKVWAIWRWDLGGHYEYNEAKQNMLNKYPDARPILVGISAVTNNAPGMMRGEDVGGVELYDGRCDRNPFNQAVTGDSVHLENSCNMFFKLKYNIFTYSGLPQLTGGEAILADLSQGKAFFAEMRSSARRDATQQIQSLQKSQF